MKKSTTIFVFCFEKTRTGFSAYIDDEDLVIATTFGDSISEMIKNSLEAVNLYLEDDSEFADETNLMFKFIIA